MPRLCARQEAPNLFPQLSVEDPPCHRNFLARYLRYQTVDRDYFTDPEWPLRPATEIAENKPFQK